MIGAKRVWLHIGVPKSGTSALQRYLGDHADALRAQGLTYLAPKRKKSGNDLAIALNRGRDSLRKLSDDLCHQIETCPTDQAILSSEMFYGIEPSVILEALPALRGRDVQVLVYLRRQDKYLESKYIQKSKNGRFKGDIWKYLRKFNGSGANFAAELAPWEAQDVTLVPRICEPGRLHGGSTVSDMLGLAGLPAPDAAAVAAAHENASPSAIRLEMMQILGRVEGLDTKRIQRRLASDHPPAPGSKARMFGKADRLAVLAEYADGNEVLRRRYFASQTDLFDMTDLDAAPTTPDVGFTDEQRAEIGLLLSTIALLYGADSENG
ncbi:MAG: hypothetical protein ACPG4X_07145 [Pikeienuella sp.]